MSEAKTHVIDGVTYVEVKRKAEVGDKVLIVSNQMGHDLDIGSIYTLERDGYTNRYYIEEVDGSKKDYVVIELLQTVDTTQASPAVIDMLANLARRVTQLESQLRATQRNLETWAENTENNKHAIISVNLLAESNKADIRTLDERTQVINAITKFYKEGSR
jgi:hypothetical protein